jgi:hypothetical protein
LNGTYPFSGTTRRPPPLELKWIWHSINKYLQSSSAVSVAPLIEPMRLIDFLGVRGVIPPNCRELVILYRVDEACVRVEVCPVVEVPGSSLRRRVGQRSAEVIWIGQRSHPAIPSFEYPNVKTGLSAFFHKAVRA